MKIKIDEHESYEIEIDREYTQQEFLQLLERLVKISQIVMKETDVGTSEEEEKQKKPIKGRGEPTKEKCIYCSSNNLTRYGFDYENGKKYQRYSCKDCGKRFSEFHRVKGIIPKTYKKKKAIIRWNNRDEAIKVMKVHYHGSKEDKENFVRLKGAPDWISIMKVLHNLRRRFNIQPQEVGLERFPKRDEKKKGAEESPRFFKASSPNPPLEIKRRIEEKREEKKIKKGKEFDIDEFLREQ